jgi:arsenate reductase (glutaredoxin)
MDHEHEDDSPGCQIREKAREKGSVSAQAELHTCRKARKFLEKRDYQLYFRDLAKQRLSSAELEKLIGNRDHTDFLNTRNETYREENMKEDPPSRKEAIKWMSREPNLIRRPVVVAGGRVVLGFDEKGLARL